MSENKTASSISPGGRLLAALTDEQIETLRDVAAEAGHLESMDDRLRSADSDLADTIRRILHDLRIQSEATASSQKTVEIWSTLTCWSRRCKSPKTWKRACGRLWFYWVKARIESRSDRSGNDSSTRAGAGRERIGLSRIGSVDEGAIGGESKRLQEIADPMEDCIPASAQPLGGPGFGELPESLSSRESWPTRS